MTRPRSYPASTRRAQSAPAPDPARVAADLSFYRPTEPPDLFEPAHQDQAPADHKAGTEGRQDQDQAAERARMVRTIINARADWFAAAALVLDSAGPAAFTDAALGKLAAIVGTLEGERT
jgi:hypothetical protein